jgi:DNA-binding transcriptional LysR family regulator
MDKLQARQTFVRVVETGSFSAVAREARSSQSAVSKQVAALESALGAKLLARTTRSLSLTEEGERYFEQARRLVAEVAEAESNLREGEQQLQGWLRVAASGAFGRLKLFPLVQSFLASHPAVKIDLRLADGFVDLVEQGVDVAVRIGELSDSGLVARRVGSTCRALVAHRDYLRQLAAGTPLLNEPEDLLSHQCIIYSELSTLNAWTFVAGPGATAEPGTIRTVRVSGNLVTNSSEVVREATLSGAGLAYAPRWMFDDEIARGEAVCLLPDWRAPHLPIHLVSPPQRRHSAKVRAFGDHLAANLRVDLPAGSHPA